MYQLETAPASLGRANPLAQAAETHRRTGDAAYVAYWTPACARREGPIRPAADHLDVAVCHAGRKLTFRAGTLYPGERRFEPAAAPAAAADPPGRVRAACGELQGLAGPAAFDLFPQAALREFYERGLYALIGRAHAAD